MLNFFTHRIGIILKVFVLLLAIIAGVAYCVGYIYTVFNTTMLNTYGIVVDFDLLFMQMSLKPIWGAIAIIAVVSILFVLDLIFFIRRINNAIKSSLEEFKLQDHFPHFYSNLTFNQTIKNITELMALYKTLDVMKTARVGIENGTINPLLNNVSEGIIFVNKHKVVSHINHIAESMLGLIPGEALGEVFSRQINNEQILELIDKTLEYDHKTVDLSLDDNTLSVGVFPIKDKFGDLVRVVILLKSLQKNPTKKVTKQ